MQEKLFLDKRNKNILEYFYPMFVYLRLSLTANFRICGDIATGRIILKPLDIFLNILILTVDCILLYFTTTGFFFTSKIYLLNLGHQIIFVVAALTLIAMHMIMFIHRKTIWTIFQQLHFFDVQMAQLKNPVNNERCFRYMWIFFLSEAALLVMLALFKLILFYPNWGMIFSESMFNLFLFICTNMQLTILILILIRFQQFNKCLKLQNNLTWQLVRRMSILYDKLNEALDKNNKCYFSILCLWVGIWFVFAVFTVFSVIVSWFYFDTATIQFVISDTATFFISTLLFACTLLVANLIVREVSLL